MGEVLVTAKCQSLVFGVFVEATFSVATYENDYFEVRYNDTYSTRAIAEYQSLGEALHGMACAIEEEISELEY